MLITRRRIKNSDALTVIKQNKLQLVQLSPIRIMAETEKLEATKRAYAEMILNTAREAAARVMAAELRSRRMEQELNCAKEEAAGMLLRLKQMIDAKTKEAEIASLGQQRKFDELEAQLNEAEGIILDLRAELNQVEGQLYKMKNKKTLTETDERGIKLKDTRSFYELFTPSLNSGPEFEAVGSNNLSLDCCALDQKDCGPAKQSMTYNSECDIYSGDNNHVLDQIKEPERFRNGCTQRICATEASLTQERFPVGEKIDPSKNFSNTETVNAFGSNCASEDKVQNIKSFAVSNNNSALEEKVQKVKNDAISIIRRSVRKRKSNFWDDVITACGMTGSFQSKKPCLAFPHFPCSITRRVERYEQYGEDQAEDETKIKSLNHAEAPQELIPTETLPENMELVDVLVEQDELAATFELSSSSRIVCDVERDTATKASNSSYADGKRLCKYTFNSKWKKKSMIFNRKWKKNSMVYNRKWKKKSMIYPEKSS